MIYFNLLPQQEPEQVHFPIDKCLFCDGFDYKCSTYTPLEDGTCVWYKVIDTDLEKIAKGDDCVTFPDLIKILKERE